ncbi:MAG: chaperone modulator CbpM [Methylacidiphilales bacterium]|nr:chaperone modulator CbpM [Candidatus Methylacidiphilales bacterium]
MSESELPANSPADAVYTIETVERITHIPKERIVLYYEYGLVATVAAADESSLQFDEQAIHQLRRIANLLSQYDFNPEGLRMVASLLGELERLREEIRFLRERS